MSSFENQPPSPIKLPHTLAIGFTGHRSLPDEAKCREAIRNVLADWMAMSSGAIYCVSSAAAGGDLLFAETCMDLNLPFRILLPSPKQEFRGDFDDSTWARAERQWHNALSVDVTGVSEQVTQRYYECGIETIQQSELPGGNSWDG